MEELVHSDLKGTQKLIYILAVNIITTLLGFGTSHPSLEQNGSNQYSKSGYCNCEEQLLVF